MCFCHEQANGIIQMWKKYRYQSKNCMHCSLLIQKHATQLEGYWNNSQVGTLGVTRCDSPSFPPFVISLLHPSELTFWHFAGISCEGGPGWLHHRLWSLYCSYSLRGFHSPKIISNYMIKIFFSVIISSPSENIDYLRAIQSAWLVRYFNYLPKDCYFENLWASLSSLKSKFHKMLTLQPFNSHKWSRQNFSSEYQYNINQISDENKEKYKFGDN